MSLWHLPVYYSWCRWPVPVTFHFNNIVFYFYVILHLRLCCIFKIINKHWALQAYRIVKRFTSWFPYMLTLMTFVIEPIDIAKPSKDARKHLWKALYLSIIMRVTLRAIHPPPKTVGISTLELFLRLRDMLYEWLSVILRLFVLYLMFACNGDGSL